MNTATRSRRWGGRWKTLVTPTPPHPPRGKKTLERHPPPPRPFSRPPSVPDNKQAADILLGLRFKLDLYVNYRPVRLFHERLCPLKGAKPEDVDFVVFRENTEGLYVMMGGHFKKDTPDEVATEIDLNTRKGVERILRHDFEYA